MKLMTKPQLGGAALAAAMAVSPALAPLTSVEAAIESTPTRASVEATVASGQPLTAAEQYWLYVTVKAAAPDTTDQVINEAFYAYSLGNSSRLRGLIIENKIIPPTNTTGGVVGSPLSGGAQSVSTATGNCGDLPPIHYEVSTGVAHHGLFGVVLATTTYIAAWNTYCQALWGGHGPAVANYVYGDRTNAGGADGWRQHEPWPEFNNQYMFKWKGSPYGAWHNNHMVTWDQCLFNGVCAGDVHDWLDIDLHGDGWVCAVGYVDRSKTQCWGVIGTLHYDWM